jgi:hypothetical protein
MSYFDFCCEFWPEVLLVTSSVCEEGCFRLRSVEVEVSPACPLHALHCTGFELPDHPINILPTCYPSIVVYAGAAFSLRSLFHALH